MFYYLNGTLAYADIGCAVIDCGGVGYQLTVSAMSASLLSAKVGTQVKLYTHLAVREDGVELFGFISTEERTCFHQLTSVSGVGPKAAMSILSCMKPDQLAVSIATEDTKSISRAPGIGAKTAARIVLELKDKISKDMMSASVGVPAGKAGAAQIPTGALTEAAEALVVLGYDKNSVLNALKGLDAKNADSATLIREALRKLSAR